MLVEDRPVHAVPPCSAGLFFDVISVVSGGFEEKTGKPAAVLQGGRIFFKKNKGFPKNGAARETMGLSQRLLNRRRRFCIGFQQPGIWLDPAACLLKAALRIKFLQPGRLLRTFEHQN
ncbi:MAG: hypothetical protein IT260_10710 [Saprospiraceae bacterium]|nr:hypothetical protein [Saprospiraceae bacterium]